MAGPKKDENADSSAATEGGGALEQVTNQSKTDKQAKKPSNAKQLPKLEVSQKSFSCRCYSGKR